MKAALVEQARARGVSPSEFLRAALADALGPEAARVAASLDTVSVAPTAHVRLSLRMSSEDRLACLAAARQAGLTPGAFVAGLVAGVPVLKERLPRGDRLAALVASNAEMATIARKLGELVSLFRQGSTQAAHDYRVMLDGLAHEFREHVRRMSAVLAEIRPARGTTQASRLSGGQDV